MTDTMSNVPAFYVREAPLHPMPPPAAMTGAIGWLRANLLSTPFNIALTLACVLLLVCRPSSNSSSSMRSGPEPTARPASSLPPVRR